MNALRTTALALILLASFPAASLAQDAPLTASLKDLYDITTTNITKTAEMLSEDLYDYRPTESVRTAGQLFGHIANAQYAFCASAAGEEQPEHDNFEETATTKAALMAALTAAFAFCNGVYSAMTDEAGAEMQNFFGNPMAASAILASNSAHNYEHYGNLVTYLRMNDLVPPSSQQQGVDEPFRVMGNIYYVGGRFGSYLITTPEGHILHDTGSNDMHEGIVSNVEKLGFNVRDIRIMISSHAHWDHIGGHAAMKRVTGAEVVALGGDAVALQSGSRNFEPVTVDRVIEDGDVVTLGGVTLRALWTPGHTQGATLWTTNVQEDGNTYSVAFRGGEIPNRRVPLFDNPRYPTVIEDTQRTLQRLREMDPPDLFTVGSRCQS